MAELTCPSCGKQLTEYTRFCPECGARLPEPQAPTPPPGGLRTVVLPPADAPEAPAEPPTQPAEPVAFPPTVRLDPPAAPQPAAPPLSLPPAAGHPEAGQAQGGGGRRSLWWILGGVGCLTVLLVGACVSIGALTIIGRSAVTGVELAATPVAGGGGIVPGDSPLAGGGLLLEDDFSDEGTSNLDVFEDATSRSAYESGAYVLEVKAAETVVWSLVGGPYSDISVEVEAEVPADSDMTSAGVVFNYQDGDNFYLFSVSNDGYYVLEMLQGGDWVTLIDPTLSEEVDAARNTLRVETRGGRIALYVNGALLEETTDSTFASGDVGLAVSTFPDSTGTVRFDNLVIARSE
ncbi:MAG TPA: zinc-ribbon domain-containing protein [Chloroflexaceae bacterium]|nr:zinc-ribbon domain-containing protein [Chloroflexaceae bacterium]